MYVYSLDIAEGNVEQIKCDTDLPVRDYFKKQGYTKVKVDREADPFFVAGDMKMYKGLVHCTNQTLNLKKDIKFTVYQVKEV